MAERTLRPALDDLAAEWDRAWSDALSALELDVAHAEALLTSAPSDGTPLVRAASRPDWVAPALTGPLPERLRARAEAIAARQARVAADLSRAIAAARQELRLAERIQAHALDRSTPAFLDASF
jgi:stage V sporulation protein SpoVS